MARLALAAGIAIARGHFDRDDRDILRNARTSAAQRRGHGRAVTIQEQLGLEQRLFIRLGRDTERRGEAHARVIGRYQIPRRVESGLYASAAGKLLMVFIDAGIDDVHRDVRSVARIRVAVRGRRIVLVRAVEVPQAIVVDDRTVDGRIARDGIDVRLLTGGEIPPRVLFDVFDERVAAELLRPLLAHPDEERFDRVLPDFLGACAVRARDLAGKLRHLLREDVVLEDDDVLVFDLVLAGANDLVLRDGGDGQQHDGHGEQRREKRAA